MKVKFKILCANASNEAKLTKEESVTHLLVSNETIWESPIVKTSLITERDKSLIVSISKISTITVEEAPTETSFEINAEGNYSKIDKIRIPLLEFLDSHNLKHKYVLQDDVSQSIATTLYPEINKIENGLRGYLIKFFITKLGSNWWDITADNEMKKKANLRKKNEANFSKFIDNRIYLIDFGELGKMVHSLSTGFLNKDDIISEILQMEETPEAVQKLKSNIEGNYIKYFKDSFKDKKFQELWEKLEKLRNKIAHNNLFVSEDLKKGKAICAKLLNIISTADKSINDVEVSLEQRDILLNKSISNINDLYGKFIRTYSQFVFELSEYGKRREIPAAYDDRIIPNILISMLLKSKNISQEEFDNYHLIITFRNKLLHEPFNPLLTKKEKRLPHMIGLILDQIKILSEKH